MGVSTSSCKVRCHQTQNPTEKLGLDDSRIPIDLYVCVALPYDNIVTYVYIYIFLCLYCFIYMMYGCFGCLLQRREGVGWGYLNFCHMDS